MTMCNGDKVIVYDKTESEVLALADAMKKYKLGKEAIVQAIEDGTRLDGLFFDIPITIAKETEFEFDI